MLPLSYRTHCHTGPKAPFEGKGQALPWDSSRSCERGHLAASPSIVSQPASLCFSDLGSSQSLAFSGTHSALTSESSLFWSSHEGGAFPLFQRRSIGVPTSKPALPTLLQKFQFPLSSLTLYSVLPETIPFSLFPLPWDFPILPGTTFHTPALSETHSFSLGLLRFTCNKIVTK